MCKSNCAASISMFDNVAMIASDINLVASKVCCAACNAIDNHERTLSGPLE
jgi:hypothetical protein